MTATSTSSAEQETSTAFQITNTTLSSAVRGPANVQEMLSLAVGYAVLTVFLVIIASRGPSARYTTTRRRAVPLHGANRLPANPGRHLVYSFSSRARNSEPTASRSRRRPAGEGTAVGGGPGSPQERTGDRRRRAESHSRRFQLSDDVVGSHDVVLRASLPRRLSLVLRYITGT